MMNDYRRISGLWLVSLEEKVSMLITFCCNPAISRVLLEGDVVLPQQRNAMECWRESCRWRKSSSGLVEVPYIASIKETMEDFQKKTCVRFVPHVGQPDFLSIQNGWCQLDRRHVLLSFVGVGPPLLLHALGIHHKHTRTDRDQYDRINWENVPAASSSNFQKAHTNNLNTPYDYSSFGAETITPIPDPSVLVEQREDMSDTEILRVNRFYECSE
uniref:Metalloendopeptidase n=1 Tax=Acanthochromis polyacanthus TaxID=80966 RepID=A0A3Q1G9Z4_9TELE